jgi:hypothetical protein
MILARILREPKGENGTPEGNVGSSVGIWKYAIQGSVAVSEYPDSIRRLVYNRTPFFALLE